MAGQWARSRQLLGLQTAAADGSLLQAKLHLYPRFLPDHQPVAHFPPVSHFLQNHKDFLLHQLTLKRLKSKRPLMTSNDEQTQLGELILIKHTQHHHHHHQCISASVSVYYHQFMENDDDVDDNDSDDDSEPAQIQYILLAVYHLGTSSPYLK